MSPLRTLAFALLLVHAAGCASPGGSDPAGGDGGNGTSPQGSVYGGVRVTLEDHAVEGTRVTLVLDVTNAEAQGTVDLTYLHLAVAGTLRTLYFDVGRALAAGERDVVSVSTTDGEGLARSPWVNLTLHYRVPAGEHVNDRSTTLDLRGQGLPRNAS